MKNTKILGKKNSRQRHTIGLTTFLDFCYCLGHLLFLGIELYAQRIKNQKEAVNPMVWRCREFFVSNIFVFLNLFRPLFFSTFLGICYFLGHVLFLNIELCAQRIKQI